MLPKQGVVELRADGEGTRIDYQVEVAGFAKYWMLFFAIAFCWLIFPPLVVRRALKHHPDRLMRNLLQGL